MSRVYKTERTLFAVALVISLVFWLALIVGTFGIALIYIAIGALVYLFVQSAFISWLRGNGVRVTAQQFPKLHAQVEHCCRILEISPRPEVYLVNSEGMLNALATKFLGDHFIVLYSEVVEALEDRPEALNFYIGHELGHIKSNHLNWGPVLWPGMLLPHLGTAYSRAREYTCDLYGLACCASREDAERALAVLASGDSLWKQLDIEQYQLQTAQTGGFWMSFHEYTADYPWLVKRVEHIRAVHAQRPRELPRRSVLAFLLACLVPRMGAGAGGGVGALIVLAMIGILAAVAIPAYKDYQQRALELQGLGAPVDTGYSDETWNTDEYSEEYAEESWEQSIVDEAGVRATVEQAVADSAEAREYILNHVAQTGEWPASLEETGYPGFAGSEAVSEVVIDQDMDLAVVLGSSELAGSVVYFTPAYDENGNPILQCWTIDFDAYLPESCR